ncbi:GTP-binding protein [Nocardioides sp. NPDC092400]|uniref:GTP-binding protein n=1 Tax=Nocardioides sp. NPDC092400 TaxID=3155196 RepID=UPI00343D5672
MRVPVVVLTGVDRDAVAATAVGLQFDLPGAVSVRHEIDVERSVLRRVVSDVHGLVEEDETGLEHACVSCALREDVLPTLERVARSGRWSTIVAHLPVGAEADQLCHVVAVDSRLARHLRIASVVTALAGPTVVDDLLGDDLLAERGAHTGPDDRRGVGEVGCAMVERADVAVTYGDTDPVALALLRALARPGAEVVAGTEHLDAARATGRLHDHERTLAWTGPALDGPVPPLAGADAALAWRLDLASPHPFHPDRLLDHLEALAGDGHRSRGVFWLPTRPGRALVWDGSGGQLSVGDAHAWASQPPHTRLVATGIGPAPAELRRVFDATLLGPDEASATRWTVGEDGFEPWLGPVRDVA